MLLSYYCYYRCPAHEFHACIAFSCLNSDLSMCPRRKVILHGSLACHYKCVIFSCRIWWTLTGNFGNILPIDWSKSCARKLQLPALNLRPRNVSELMLMHSICCQAIAGFQLILSIWQHSCSPFQSLVLHINVSRF